MRVSGYGHLGRWVDESRDATPVNAAWVSRVVGHVDTIAAFPCCCVYLSGGVTILTTRGSLHVPRLVVVKYEREVHVSISTRTRKIARV